ncbi:hypothetical protein TALC_00412 [Thermoplasmatales archaeon BRNA1]|nr:hypothetical protein TALC_00412 [Thermoplasmatales archaeon BRNA1]
MSDSATAKKPLSKSFSQGSNFTGIIAEWEGGRQSVQLRVSPDFREAFAPVSDIDAMDGDKAKYTDEAKDFVKFGTFDVYKSDFAALLPVFTALARANGYDVTITTRRS